ncbi:hypothetical protein BG015_006240, partial [Linnemannia schmuckeri]
MRFTTTVASALALILAATTATVSAQGFSAGCSTCLLTAAQAVSPACNQATFQTTNAPSEMTPQEKACFCPLSSDADSTWIQQ